METVSQEQATLAAQVYEAAYNTDEDFNSPFGADILFLIGAILRGTVVQVVNIRGFISELPNDIQEQLSKYIVG